MKKIIIAIVVILLMAGAAHAGLKNIVDAGEKGEDFRSVVLALKTFKNVQCQQVADLETKTGVDLKNVTNTQISNYFAPIVLDADTITAIRQAAVAIDTACELINSLTMPQTD